MKELFIDKLLIELKTNILSNLKKETKTLDEEEKNNLNKIINKYQLNLDDINDLLIDYLPFECTNDQLIDIVIKEKLPLKKYIKYLIYEYLITTKDTKSINVILKKLNYNYTINDVITIEKYLTTKKTTNTIEVLELIDKIWTFEQTKPNSLFKDKINNLKVFYNLVDNELLPYNLVNSFIKVKKQKNLYKELIELEKIMISTTKYPKEMLCIYLTYNYQTSSNIEEYFKNISLSKEELLDFIKKLEEKDIILDEKRLSNLFQNFKNKYYREFNLKDKYIELSNKVVKEYFNYSSNHFYFTPKEFINYYNNSYQDDFSLFTFQDTKTNLTENILNSIFNQDSLLGNYYLLKKDTKKSKTFKNLNKKTENYEKEQLELFGKRKKFYRKYKCKLNDYLNNEDICFKYYLIKYIKETDRQEFYELFKTIYKDNYRKLETRKVPTKNKVQLLKKDFIEELTSTNFKDRYKVIEKYKEIATIIGCNTGIKETYYQLAVEELERKYYLLLVKNIITRLELSIKNQEDISYTHKKIEEYLEKEVNLSIEELLNKLANKKHNDLKERYQNIKKDLNPKKLIKRKM